MKLTRNNIEDLKTGAGGYNYATIEALGEETPPTSGWIERLIGKEISKESYQKALECSKIVKRKRLPNIIKPLDLHIVYSINGQIKEAFKHWDLGVAELVLERMGAEYWEIGIACKPHLAEQL